MTALLFENMAGASLLMLLVLAARQPVAKAFGANWAYALWLLPALRFVLPPLPSLAPAQMPTITVVIAPTVQAMAAPAPAATGSADWLSLLLALWVGGAVVFAIWQHSSYSAFVMHLGGKARPADPPEYGGIHVVESDAVDGPVAVGFFNRRIVVPLEFSTRYSPAERRLALAHELVHHRRLDLWANLAALTMLALNWFNPIAHFAFRAFRADQELACDAAVTRRAAGEERHDYARALVKASTRQGYVAACPLNHADTLKRRLKMMNQHRGGTLRAAGGISALTLMGAAGLLLSAPGMAKDGAADSRLLIDPAGAPSDIIDEADVARLVEACRSGKHADADADDDSVIVCDGGKRVSDPEARRIVRRTVERARAKAVAAMPSAERMADIQRQVEAAVVQVDRVDHARIAAEVERALAAARVADHALPQAVIVRSADGREERVEAGKIMADVRAQLAAVDWKSIRASALVRAEVQQALAEAGIERREALREAREAIAEARRELRRTDFRRELREADEEWKRESGEANFDEAQDPAR